MKLFDRAAQETPVELLRINTSGSVDNGKSTLIGRLLYDTKQIHDDQMEALQRSADITGEGTINLANLTDGLRAEREEGITIDVAYRYFSTQKREFIVADTPGHIQYTRNMVTGASTSHAAIVLVDVRHGLNEQTRRHMYISSLLRVPFLLLCVNKMDLVKYSESEFKKIQKKIHTFCRKLKFKGIHIIPISALQGDNVVHRSSQMSWYDGKSLLEILEHLDVNEDLHHNARFSVQYILRPKGGTSAELHDFRGYAGKICSGIFRVGEDIVVFPSKQKSRIKQIHSFDGNLDEAFAPMSVSFLLEDDIDVSRGDLITGKTRLPKLKTEFVATVCWMHDQPLEAGQKLILKHLSNTIKGVVRSVEYRLNIDNHKMDRKCKALLLNDIGRVRFETTKPFAFDPYEHNRAAGGVILIDEVTNATVGAAMILVR
jgi:sulfate adenylyltransferase large subunit